MGVARKWLIFLALGFLVGCGGTTQFTGDDTESTEASFLLPDAVEEGDRQTYSRLDDADILDVVFDSTATIRASGADEDGLRSVVVTQLEETAFCANSIAR